METDALETGTLGVIRPLLSSSHLSCLALLLLPLLLPQARLRERVAAQSIWTIDLAFLLHRKVSSLTAPIRPICHTHSSRPKHLDDRPRFPPQESVFSHCFLSHCFLSHCTHLADISHAISPPIYNRGLFFERCLLLFFLLFFLHSFGVRFTFWTATLGVNTSYNLEAFYKPTLENDSLRVNALFDAAPTSGIHIERRSLSPQDLQEMLSEAGADGAPPGFAPQMVMALIDRKRLASGGPGGPCPPPTPTLPPPYPHPTPTRPPPYPPLSPSPSPPHPKPTLNPPNPTLKPPYPHATPTLPLPYPHPTPIPPSSAGSALGAAFALLGRISPSSSYVGHYVLLTSFDRAKDAYCVIDPAGSAEVISVDSRVLDGARLAHGTDEDLLLIPWDQQPTGQLPLGAAVSPTTHPKM